MPYIRSMITGSAIGAFVLLTVVSAQDAKKTSWDGVYTEEQAARGQKSFKAICGYCHGDDLNGGETGPALIASFFRVRWRGQTVADMFDAISSTMPKTAPGTLKPQEYVDIDRKSTRLNSSHIQKSRMPSSA